MPGQKIKSIKLPQYPDYLADNRAKLSEDEYAAYNKQCELTRRFHKQTTNKQTTNSVSSHAGFIMIGMLLPAHILILIV